MSTLLQKLGEDWHNPHPYESLIHTILPTTEKAHGEKIERCLIGLYVDEHNGFKNTKSESKHTIYDLELDVLRAKKTKLDQEYKKEEDIFEKICKKFEEMGTTTKVQRSDEPNEESEEEKEVEDTYVEAPQQKDKPIQKSSKETLRLTKERETRDAVLAKSIKSSMATSQEKLMELQKELAQVEDHQRCYKQYQGAAWYYLGAMKKAVLAYESKKDMEVLIKELDSVLRNYNTFLRSNVPNERCSGDVKGLCEKHYLPMRNPYLYEKNEGWTVKCNLSPETRCLDA